MNTAVLAQVGAIGIVPVIVIDNAADAVPLAQALLEGGIDCIEITMRTAPALDAMTAIRDEVPDMLLGAGTVITIDQAEQALAAGARFLVSPGYDPEFVAWCLERGVPVLPGAVTPSEIMAARKQGLRVVKFFPADVYGGVKAIKALSSPFADMKFMPTGGVNLETLAEFLRVPAIHAVGGSWIASKAQIAAGKFDEIARLARESVAIAHEVRGS
ncbi:MAG: bifunctional 4-hydroxy-2-oxoglutarate aldolase/2-dehydro-3-deoxy-phosphogluconate aldolase [Anaerolineae bacterium]|nr:bifunctional 4-hydroxy-2-oxoglutarate aldolase/2-dehydro-3-deoxy-phosphogluconate aldolase [Anaerolineae bacterium]